MDCIRSLVALVALAMVCSAPSRGFAQGRLSLHCEVDAAAGRNHDKVPKWLEVEVDFYSGHAKVTAPGIGGNGSVVSNGQLTRDTDRLFSVQWRSLVELGYYKKTNIMAQRLSVMKANGTGRYRSDGIRDRGNLSGTVRCRSKPSG